IDKLKVPINALIRTSTLSTHDTKIAVNLSTNNSDYSTDLYEVSLSGFKEIGRMPSSPSFVAVPRVNPWSHDNRFLALHNILDNKNNRLSIYDTISKTFFQPTNLSEVFNVTWSPAQDMIAFIAYNSVFDGADLTYHISDFAIYVTQFDGTVFVKLPIKE